MSLHNCFFPHLINPTPSQSTSIPSLLDINVNLNVNQPFPRFFIIKLDEPGETFHDASPFDIQRGVKYYIGAPKSVQKLRDGSLLVEASSDEEAKKLLNLKSFGPGWSLSVQAHKTLNSCKGVIYCPDLMDNEEENILTEMKDQLVTEVKRIFTRKEGVLKPSPLLILTFNTTILPDHIFIGYIRVGVRRHVPNPMRCLKCQMFGHIQINCKKPSVCGKCGKSDTHGDTPCDEKASCPNCGDPHPAWSRECPVWIRERRVMEVKVTDGVSYSEARKRLQNFAQKCNPDQSFAAATSKPPKQDQAQELGNLMKMMSLLLAGQNENKDKLDIQTKKIEEQTEQIRQLRAENQELKTQNQKMEIELAALKNKSNTPSKKQQEKQQQQQQQQPKRPVEQTINTKENKKKNTKIPKLDPTQTSDDEQTGAIGKKVHEKITFRTTDEDDEPEPMEMGTEDLRKKLMKTKRK